MNSTTKKYISDCSEQENETDSSRRSHPDVRFRDQIKAYIRCEVEGEDDDPLSFWRSNASKFPLLQELVRDTLSQSASSVPVENMFPLWDFC